MSNSRISLFADTIIDLQLDNESIVKISQPDTINLRPDETIKFTFGCSTDNTVIEQLNNGGDNKICSYVRESEGSGDEALKLNAHDWRYDTKIKNYV